MPKFIFTFARDFNRTVEIGPYEHIIEAEEAFHSEYGTWPWQTMNVVEYFAEV